VGMLAAHMAVLAPLWCLPRSSDFCAVCHGVRVRLTDMERLCTWPERGRGSATVVLVGDARAACRLPVGGHD